eukprot:scaffold8628_cov149-Amphora_coffeaeformis.AAC.9
MVGKSGNQRRVDDGPAAEARRNGEPCVIVEQGGTYQYMNARVDKFESAGFAYQNVTVQGDQYQRGALKVTTIHITQGTGDNDAKHTKGSNKPDNSKTAVTD